MNQEIKQKKCQNPGCEKTFTPGNSLDKFCSWPCAKPHVKPIARKQIEGKPFDPIKAKRNRIPRKTALKKISPKMKSDLAKYHKDRLLFLDKSKNKICPVTFQSTTEVHHMKGRVGYADQFARDNEITLLHDQRFWLGVSRNGHRKIEENPEWAKEHGFSLDRLSDG